MSIRIKGLSGLKADIAGLSDNIVAGTAKAQEAVASALADDIAERAPVQTGALRNSVEADGPEISVGGSNAPYAEDVEENDPFIQPAIQAMVKKGDEIAGDAIRREIG